MSLGFAKGKKPNKGHQRTLEEGSDALWQQISKVPGILFTFPPPQKKKIDGRQAPAKLKASRFKKANVSLFNAKNMFLLWWLIVAVVGCLVGLVGCFFAVFQRLDISDLEEDTCCDK